MYIFYPEDVSLSKMGNEKEIGVLSNSVQIKE